MHRGYGYRANLPDYMGNVLKRTVIVIGPHLCTSQDVPFKETIELRMCVFLLGGSEISPGIY